MHPDADELFNLLEGDAKFLLESDSGLPRLLVQGRGLVAVPRGVWHTARVHARSRMLHVTTGSGTRHRPATKDT
jgi:oxalate decarboxylase/phosphoglucose isomerase-like protein (cupin superfamily)